MFKIKRIPISSPNCVQNTNVNLELIRRANMGFLYFKYTKYLSIQLIWFISPFFDFPDD